MKNEGCIASLLMLLAWVGIVFLVAWLTCLCFEVPFKLRYAIGVLIIAATARILTVGVTINRKQQ